MLTLGIETSCDETALALVRDGVLVHHVMSTQADVHALFGGVVPEIASREHYRLIGVLFDSLLEQTGTNMDDIDAIAVSRGPGLLGSLLVGLGFAKGLAASSGAKLVGVNHLHAHLLACGLEAELPFPALGLLVSGGHTHIYRVSSATEFSLLGRTLDDAAGEAFDKVAKMLNMPYPGGKFIDQLGRMAEPDTKLFTKPYIRNDNLDFSFSGLKTAVGLYIEKHPELRLSSLDDAAGLFDGRDVSRLAALCASFNYTVAETLCVKMERALNRQQEPVKALVVAGGVAANSRVRERIQQLAKKHSLAICLPSLTLCTDNAAMVAYAGEQLVSAGLCHNLSLEAIPRGRKIPDDYCVCE